MLCFYYDYFRSAARSACHLPSLSALFARSSGYFRSAAFSACHLHYLSVMLVFSSGYFRSAAFSAEHLPSLYVMLVCSSGYFRSAAFSACHLPSLFVMLCFYYDYFRSAARSACHLPSLSAMFARYSGYFRSAACSACHIPLLSVMLVFFSDYFRSAACSACHLLSLSVMLGFSSGWSPKYPHSVSCSLSSWGCLLVLLGEVSLVLGPPPPALVQARSLGGCAVEVQEGLPRMAHLPPPLAAGLSPSLEAAERQWKNEAGGWSAARTSPNPLDCFVFPFVSEVRWPGLVYSPF